MSKSKVYLETSFFRYLVAQPSQDPRKADRQRMTREWWEQCRHKYELRVSVTVYEEFYDVGPGKISGVEAAERLILLQTAELLPVESVILELAALLIEPQGPLPAKAQADAIHWAVASHFGCEYVLTWNFKHLNNAAIKRRAERIIRDYGFESPTLCIPEELEGRDLDGPDA